MGRPRILISDDHNLALEGLQRILEPHFEVVGAVGDGHSLLSMAPKLKPDVILVDIGMPLLKWSRGRPTTQEPLTWNQVHRHNNERGS